MLSLVKVAPAFAGVLFSLRRRVHLAWTMLAAAMALGAVALACAAIFGYGPRRLWGIGRRSVVAGHVTTMFAVMLFKDVLLATGALSELPATLAGLGIAPLAAILVFALPAGVLTGSSQSSIIMALPLPASMPGGTNGELFALVFVWGFSGLMLAPAHPCFILTVQHFRTSFATVQRLVLLPQAASATMITAFYWLLSGRSA